MRTVVLVLINSNQTLRPKSRVKTSDLTPTSVLFVSPRVVLREYSKICYLATQKFSILVLGLVEEACPAALHHSLCHQERIL